MTDEERFRIDDHPYLAARLVRAEDDLATARALLEDVEERAYDGQRIPVNLFDRIVAFLHQPEDGA